jgi:PAC2 family
VTDASTSQAGPVVVLAFAGWSDAADVATETLDYLSLVFDAAEVKDLDLQEFMDFQVNRPHILFNDFGERVIEWPTARIRRGRVPSQHRDIYLIDSDEPNMRWRDFTTLVMDEVVALRPASVVFLGALIAELPHSRPLPVTGQSSSPFIAERCGFADPSYEGPTGIVGVLTVESTQRKLETTSLWVALPHYVAQPPCPLGVVALLNSLEDVLGFPIEQGDYPEQTRAWQRSCDDLMEADRDLRKYVTELEEQHDSTELPESTGDAIAKEFERYLRRRTDQD